MSDERVSPPVPDLLAGATVERMNEAYGICCYEARSIADETDPFNRSLLLAAACIEAVIEGRETGAFENLAVAMEPFNAIWDAERALLRRLAGKP